MGEKVEKVSGSFLSGFVVTGTSVLPRINRRIDSLNTPATVSGANAVYTAAQIARGIILRDTSAGNRTDTLPDASDIKIGIANVYTLPAEGDSIQFEVRNDGNNVLTLAPGSATSLQGDFVIPSGGIRILTAYMVGSSAIVVSVNPYAAPGSVPVQTSNITAASNQTYSAAQLLGGYITRDPAGAPRTDVTATGAQIDTARTSLVVGSYFDVTLKNTAGAANAVTLNGGVGVTLISAIVVAQNETAVLRFIKTGTATYDVVKLG
jgi:hypothetical protein